jgi:HEAT repeat protein
MSMTSTGRWKLVCGVLAIATAYSWLRDGDARVRPATATSPRAAAYRPLRVSAAALGVSVDDLISRLHSSRSPRELRMLAEQLGAVGDDAAIDAVRALVTDVRPEVPELVVAAIGTIGTDHAVDVLLELARHPRGSVRQAAVLALGRTGSSRAETFLVAQARRHDTDAIEALAMLGSDRAIEVLYRIAVAGNDHVAEVAMRKLGELEAPAARQALVRLIDAPSLQTAIAAIDAVRDVDATVATKLVAVIRGGDGQLVRPALLALAQGGDRGVTILREAALDGANRAIQHTAVAALGITQSPDAVDTLAQLTDSADDELATEAARALASIELPEARDALISAALSEHAGAVEALVAIEDDSIEPALVEIARSEGPGAAPALARLLSRGNAEALAVVSTRARSSDEDVRESAYTLLAEVGTEDATTRLLALARGEHGSLKGRVLELVAAARPSDPAVTELLREGLHGSDASTQQVAAAALGRVGTDEARDALVVALAGSDLEIKQAALQALAGYRLTTEASAAIESAVTSDPRLLPEALQRLLQARSPLALRLADRALAGSSHVAVRTLRLLGQYDIAGSAELVMRSIRARDAHVRVAAIHALVALRADRAVDVIAQASRDPSESVRTAAASALGTLGTPRARDALLAMSRSPEVNDRLLAMQYLPDDPATVPRARELLHDPNSSVAYYAMRTLARTREGVSVLRALVHDSSARFDARWDAARLLDAYGHLDARTAAWMSAHEDSDDE